MTWSARIEHTPAGLALTFGAPLSRLDMAPDVAQHLASLLATEARAAVAGMKPTTAAGPLLSSTNPDSFPQRKEIPTDFGTADLSLLAVEARSRMAGVVRTLEAENGSHAVVRRQAAVDRQNGASDSFMAENMPVQVIGNAHPLCCDCDPCLNGGHP